jgi:hypothetical protein
MIRNHKLKEFDLVQVGLRTAMSYVVHTRFCKPEPFLNVV